MQELYWRTKT